MIISGGENIYCAEVENVLAAHPQVADVALIGVADERWGETPLAVVVPTDPADPPTLAALEEHCLAHLARYKRPRRLAVVDALPRNATGKVQKTVLRERADALSRRRPDADVTPRDVLRTTSRPPGIAPARGGCRSRRAGRPPR